MVKARFLVSVCSVLFAIVLVEVLGRFFVGQCSDCYGELLGKLPPVELFPRAPSEYDPDTPVLQREEKTVTSGDLRGIIRPDAVLGFTTRESSESALGWWRSNNVGSRNTYDVVQRVPAGKRRIAVFGDSFAHGSRVKQEESFPSQLEALVPNSQVLNFGVDAYSISQAFLRYREMKEKLEFSDVQLLIVYPYDLWRDINVMHFLGRESWESFLVHPRFVLENGKLVLAASPYMDPHEVYRMNQKGLSSELREHLLQYDRYYLPLKYESPPVIGKLLTYKIIARALYRNSLARLEKRMNALDTSAEALRVQRAIAMVMKAEVEQADGSFQVILMPTEPRHDGAWEQLRDWMCRDGLSCLDLAPLISRLGREGTIDFGYDGTHFGPNTNRAIAEEIFNHIP